MQDLTVAVAQMCSTEHFSENFAQIKKHLADAIEHESSTVDLIVSAEVHRQQMAEAVRTFVA